MTKKLPPHVFSFLFIAILVCVLSLCIYLPSSRRRFL